MDEIKGSKHQVITLEVCGQPEGDKHQFDEHQFIVWGKFHHRAFRIASQVLQKKLNLEDRSNIKSVRESPVVIIDDNPNEDKIRIVEERRRDVDGKFNDDYWADETYIYKYEKLTAERPTDTLGQVATTSQVKLAVD